MFAEDGEWEKADAYLEKVLDREPENAYAYLGKLLVEFKAESPEQLKNNLDEVKNSKNFIRALRYSESDLRQFLEMIKNGS